MVNISFDTGMVARLSNVERIAVRFVCQARLPWGAIGYTFPGVPSLAPILQASPPAVANLGHASLYMEPVHDYHRTQQLTGISFQYGWASVSMDAAFDGQIATQVGTVPTC